MARSILRAGKIAGVIILVVIGVAVVLYSAGVLTFAQSDRAQAPIEPAGVPVETGDAQAVALFEEAVHKHMRAARYDEVESLCNDAIARSPGTDEALRARQSLAELYIRTRRDAAADAAVDDMVAVFGDHKRIARAVCEVGDAWRRMRNFDNAERLYSYVTEHFADDPYSMWSQKNLCTLYVQLGDDTARDAALDQLASNYGDHPDLPLAICSVGDEVVRIRKDYDKARELYAFAAANFADNEQAVWAQKNLCKLLVERIQDIDAAQVETDKLFSDFADNPNLPAAALETADAWRNKKHTLQAQVIYERIVTNHPKSIQALWSQKNICTIYAESDDEPAADSAFDQMVATFAENDQLPKAVCETADAWRAAGRADRAAALYQYVTTAYASNWHTIWSQKNLCTLHAESGNTQTADEALNKLITTHAQNDQLPKAICEVADAYRQLREYEKAIEIYDEVIARYPAHNYAMWARANLIIIDAGLAEDAGQSGPGQEIIEAIDRLMVDFEGYPDLDRAVFAIGEYYWQWTESATRSDTCTRDYAAATTIWEKIINQLPYNADFTPFVYYMCAHCCEYTKEYDKAIACYKKLTEDGYRHGRYAYRAPYRLGEIYKYQKKDYETAAYWYGQQNILFDKDGGSLDQKLFCDDAKYDMATVYRAYLKDYDTALEFYRTYLQHFPQGRRADLAPLSIGRCYRGKGDVQTAIAVIQTALDEDPHMESAGGYRRILTELQEGDK